MIVQDKPMFCFTVVLSLTVVIWMASGCKKPETEEEIRTALLQEGQMEEGTGREAIGEAGMKEAALSAEGEHVGEAMEEEEAEYEEWIPEYPTFPEIKKSHSIADFEPEYTPDEDASGTLVLKGLLRGAFLEVDGQKAVLGDGRWTTKIPLTPGTHTIQVTCGSVAENTMEIEVEEGKEVKKRVPFFFIGKGGKRIVHCGNNEIGTIMEIWADGEKAFGMVGTEGIEYFNGTHWFKRRFPKDDISLEGAQIGYGQYIAALGHDESADLSLWIFSDGKWRKGARIPAGNKFKEINMFASLSESEFCIGGSEGLYTYEGGSWEEADESGSETGAVVYHNLAVIAGEIYGIASSRPESSEEDDESVSGTGAWIFRGIPEQKLALLADAEEADEDKILSYELLDGNKNEILVVEQPPAGEKGAKIWLIEAGDEKAKLLKTCRNLEEVTDIWAPSRERIALAGCGSGHPAYCMYDGKGWRTGSWEEEEGCLMSIAGDDQKVIMASESGIIISKVNPWKETEQ